MADDLPPDLAVLERQLADRPRIDPSGDLGRRVLAAARAVRPFTAPLPASGWHTWAAIAATIAAGINLSMSVATNTEWHLAAAAEPNRIAATADWLRDLAPDLPDAELRRQALLACAGAALTPTASLTPNWERIRNTREPDRWDER